MATLDVGSLAAVLKLSITLAKTSGDAVSVLSIGGRAGYSFTKLSHWWRSAALLNFRAERGLVTMRLSKRFVKY